ncbi:hypothetical protein P3S67_012978 [Capsicum chacoense]
MLIEEGTTAAIFVRCFSNKRSIELDIQKRFNAKFPRGVLATICAVLFFYDILFSSAGTTFLISYSSQSEGMAVLLFS